MVKSYHLLRSVHPRKYNNKKCLPIKDQFDVIFYFSVSNLSIARKAQSGIADPYSWASCIYGEAGKIY